MKKKLILWVMVVAGMRLLASAATVTNTVTYSAQQFLGGPLNRQITIQLLSQGLVSGTNATFGTPQTRQPVAGLYVFTNMLPGNYTLAIDQVAGLYPFTLSSVPANYSIWDLVNAGISVLAPPLIAGSNITIAGSGTGSNVISAALDTNAANGLYLPLSGGTVTGTLSIASIAANGSALNIGLNAGTISSGGGTMGPGGYTAVNGQTVNGSGFFGNGSGLTNLALATATNNGGAIASNSFTRLNVAPGAYRSKLPPIGINNWYSGQKGSNWMWSAVNMFVTNGYVANGLHPIIEHDDGWATNRDASGNITANTNVFPGGVVTGIICYAHSNGCLVSLYTESGGSGTTNTVSGLQPSSENYFAKDAASYASWGLDCLKMDGSSWATTTAALQPSKEAFYNELVKAKALRYLHIAYYGGDYNSWLAGVTTWARPAGFLSDVTSYAILLTWIDEQNRHRQDYGPQTQWPYLDALQNSMTEQEVRSQFYMDCMLSAPLFLTTWDYPLYYTNWEAILTVHQDPAGIFAFKVYSNSLNEVWSKPLGGESSQTRAVALMNRNGTTQSITAWFTNVGIASPVCTVRDLQSHSIVGYYTNSFTTNVFSHSVEMLKFTPGIQQPFPAITNYLSDFGWMPLYSNSMYNGGNFLIPIARDKSRQGNTLSINGTTYAKGLGLYADSDLSYFLGGQATSFHATFGVDDEVGSLGGLKFLIYLDGALICDSGTNAWHSGSITTNLNVTGGNVMRIRCVTTQVGLADSNNDGDIANAYFVCPLQGVLAGDGNAVTNLNIAGSGGLTNIVSSPATVTLANGTATITNGAMESAISLTDDFIAGNGTSQTLGDLGWASTASFTVQAETVWPHVGTVDVATPTSNGGAASIYLGNSGGLWGLNTNTWASTWIFKLVSTNNCIALFGFAGANRQVQWPFAATDQAGVWGGYNYSNSAYFIFSSYGNYWTQARTVNSTIKADTSWHKLTMNGSASGVSFAIDGETPQTIATTPANQITTNPISPVFGIGNASTDATSHTLRVDYFGLRYYGVTR